MTYAIGTAGRWLGHVGILISVFVITRLIAIHVLPIFNDEAIILNFSTLFTRFPERWYMVMSDGRQPLFGITISLMQRLPIDPLVAGRLLMVLWSLIAFLFTLLVARESGYQKKSIHMAAILMILSPYLLFYDRLILASVPIVGISMVVLYVLLRFVRTTDIRLGLLLGCLFAFGWWHFTLILLFVPVVFLVFLVDAIQNPEKRMRIFFSVWAAVVLFMLLILPVITTDFYRELQANDPQRILSISDIAAIPTDIWSANLTKIVQWFFVLGGLYLVPFFILGIVRTRSAIGNILVLWVGMPVAISIIFVESMSARNLLVLVPVAILVAVRGLEIFKGYKARFAWTTVILISGLCSAVLLFSPERVYHGANIFPAVRDDVSQYVGGWTSGHGTREAAQYLKSQSQSVPTIVFVRLDPGNPEDAMYVFLRGETNIQVKPLQFIQDVYAENPDRPMYFVSRGTQTGDIHPDFLVHEKTFTKPISDEFVGVYRIVVPGAR